MLGRVLVDPGDLRVRLTLHLGERALVAAEMRGVHGSGEGVVCDLVQARGMGLSAQAEEPFEEIVRKLIVRALPDAPG